MNDTDLTERLAAALTALLGHHDRQNYPKSRTVNECDDGRVAREVLALFAAEDVAADIRQASTGGPDFTPREWPEKSA